MGINILIAQDGQPWDLLKGNKVHKIETYFLESNATQDSFLVTKEEYNQEGRRTRIGIYDSLGLANHYEYDYLSDSIRTERRTYYRNELSSVTKLVYNQDGNETSAIDYDTDGNKLAMSSKNIYNDQQQLVEVIIYNGDLVWVHRKMKYHDNGKLKESEVIKPNYLKNKVSYDREGEEKHNQNSKIYNHREVYEDYNSTGKKMEQRDSRFAYKIGVIGVKEVLNLKPFDYWRQQIFYLKNGLIDYELQFVNGRPKGRRQYKYIR